MKNKKVKETKYESEETKEIKSLIIITIVIIAITGGLYFLTENSLERKQVKEVEVEQDIDYDIATVGMIFNRPYSEYYVFAYASDDKNSNTYEDLLDSYTDKEDAKKVYYVDMSLTFNNAALAEKSNKKATNAEEIKIKDVALILIKDGKISKYYETETEIEKAFK